MPVFDITQIDAAMRPELQFNLMDNWLENAIQEVSKQIDAAIRGTIPEALKAQAGINFRLTQYVDGPALAGGERFNRISYRVELALGYRPFMGDGWRYIEYEDLQRHERLRHEAQKAMAARPGDGKAEAGQADTVSQGG